MSEERPVRTPHFVRDGSPSTCETACRHNGGRILTRTEVFLLGTLTLGWPLVPRGPGPNHQALLHRNHTALTETPPNLTCPDPTDRSEQMMGRSLLNSGGSDGTRDPLDVRRGRRGALVTDP
jgi:hypothetical protein